MFEIKRVIFSKLNILTCVLLLLLNVIFCVYTCNDARALTLEGDELEAYFGNYKAFVEKTLESADILGSLSVFGNPDSFSSRNIKKTAEDYSQMQEIQIVSGDNRAVAVYFNYRLGGVLLLIYGIFLVLCFNEERNKGLLPIIRSTVRGRGTLAAVRLGIYTLAMLVMAFLLSISSVLVVSVIYPGTQWNRSIQSVPEFMRCTLRTDLAGSLGIDMLLRALAAIALGLLLYALISVLKTGISVFIFGGVILGEYLLYKLIIPTSVFAGLRDVNLYAALMEPDVFKGYRNVNIFGYPVSLLFCLAGLAVLGALAGMLVIIIMSRRGAMSDSGILAELADQIGRAVDRRRFCSPAFIWECRKVLIDQKGLLIIALVFYLAFSGSQASLYKDLRNSYETYWYEFYAGTLTSERIAEIDANHEKLETRLVRMYNNKAKLEEQIARIEMAGGDSSIPATDLCNLELKIAKLEKELGGLRRVVNQVRVEEEYMQKTGRALELVEPYTYELLLKHDYRTCQSNRLYIIIAVVCTFSGIMAFENRSHMEVILNSQYRGRRRIIVNKIMLTVLIASITALSIHMLQFVQIGKAYGYNNTEAPVQCIAFLSDFLLPVTIRGYLILLYAGRCLTAALTGLAAMLVSFVTKDRIACMSICIFTIIVPVICFTLAF